MNASLSITILIATSGCLVGWQQNKRMDEIRKTHQRLYAEVRLRGFSPEDVLAKGRHPHQTKRPRQTGPNPLDEGNAVADELISWKKSSRKVQSDVQRSEEILGRLEELNPAQVKELIANINSKKETAVKIRVHLIHLALVKLGINYPEAALELFLESTNPEDYSYDIEDSISGILAKIAEENTPRALDWLHKVEHRYPIALIDKLKAAITCGVAKQDPQYALRLIEELDGDSNSLPTDEFATLIRDSNSPVQFVSILRDDAWNWLMEETLYKLAAKVGQDGYEVGQTLLATANLSDRELRFFSEGLKYSATQKDTGDWMNWMARNHLGDQKMHTFLSDWTIADHQAVRKWIDEGADDSIKPTAERAYAIAMATYDPLNAEKFAASFPPGQERTDFFRNVHTNLQWSNPEAAEEIYRKYLLEN